MKELWILGFVVNLFLLGSVFDIYFKSPIVKVSITHRPTVSSGIQRLVFFVADGLRADTFFQNSELRPYLTKLMEKGGESGVAYGISDTRVPTESRPGHIALFAGFYEDPSAVFTGWKNNLVEFDSVFNRSTSSVALGSPDVINMFAQGEAKSKIYSETYPSDWQDFLASNSSVLDTWVYDRFKELVKRKKLPRHDNLLVFLHLLGIDNTGHATKPHSVEYKNGLSVVDDIVLKVESLLNDYYGPESRSSTLFVFTSDHGMTDWGSHGSGSEAETETPIVIWGPGIKSTKDLRIKQADVASLVAGALGSPYPTNSVGKFPSNIFKDETFAYSALKANLIQLKELMDTKKKNVEAQRNFPLIEYSKEKDFLQGLNRAEKLAEEGKYAVAIDLLNSIFSDVFEGNVYYERYDQQLLMFFSVLTFLLLMFLVTIVVLNMGVIIVGSRTYAKRPGILSPKLLSLGGLLAIILSKGVIGWSIYRIGYLFVPSYLSLLLSSLLGFGFGLEEQKSVLLFKTLSPKYLVVGLLLSLMGVQMLVLSFWERRVLSLALLLNLFWLWGTLKKKGREMSTSSRHLLLHLVAVGTLALFPLVPIIGNEHSPFFTTVGPSLSCFLVGGLLFLSKTTTNSRQNKKSTNFTGSLTSPRDTIILSLQLLLQLSVAVLVHFPTHFPTRLLSWTSLILILSPILTSTSSRGSQLIRLSSIFLSLNIPFSFLSVSYEGLFLPSLFLVLLLFLKLEISEQSEESDISHNSNNWANFLSMSIRDGLMGNDKSNTNSKNSDVRSAFRRAWFHLFFVFLSFFGVGNISSISSFDPTSTRCFVSVFNPFVMMVLMLIKILCPFLLVSCFFRTLLHSNRDVERDFGLLLMFCEGMSLNMFFRVTNLGSWLQIGTSISHFVIVQSTTLFLFLLQFVANFLVRFELFSVFRERQILPRSSSANNSRGKDVKGL